MKPIRLPPFDAKPVMVALPTGTLLAYALGNPSKTDPAIARYSGHHVTVRSSTDNGHTWSDAQVVMDLGTESGGWFCQDGLEALADAQGEIHLFFLNDARTGVVPETAGQAAAIGEDQRPEAGQMHAQRLDIWHTRSTNGRTRWPRPRCVWQGYSGSLNSVLQLRSGRIVLPFSCLTARAWSKDRGRGVETFSFAGQFDSTVIYSDDLGTTWQASPDALRVPVPDIVSAYGAVEPVAIELADGRVWMLIRTQQGRFYESFSPDGARWSAPQPTAITASDSPAALTGLSDGRIVMFWNNCLRFPYAYGGRHVCHAAISEDNGRTWQGYREVARDPTRNDPPPPWGDHGVGYPFAVTTKDQRIILSTGQGGSRDACLLLDPSWLYETRQDDDFRNGLEDWSTFGTRGVALEPHPDDPSKRVLCLHKPDPAWPAAAVWNFPAGHSGTLRLRISLRPGCAGVHIGLTDHFSVPFDREDRFYNLFQLEIGPDGHTGTGNALTPNTWHTLLLAWNARTRRCRVSLDGRPLAVLPQRRESPGGPCYLRLASAAVDTDMAGLLLESVSVRIRRPTGARRA